MARRSDHTREELKELAIAAGQKIIIAEGLGKFSARKVAKEIGYTVGTLYNVFIDYNDIVLHINAATLDAMHIYISRQSAANSQERKGNASSLATAAIKNLATLYINFAHENYNRWNALFTFSLPQGAELPIWYIEKMAMLFVLVENPLHPLFPLREDEKAAERTAKVLWASIHGICQLGLTGKLDAVGAELVQVLANNMIENYMQGIEA